jgi:hypothetical protein
MYEHDYKSLLSKWEELRLAEKELEKERPLTNLEWRMMRVIEKMTTLLSPRYQKDEDDAA